MNIGINASFLAKPMTGIGQVTMQFLRHLSTLESFSRGKEGTGEVFDVHSVKFILYCQAEPQLDFVLPKNVEVRVFLPWWKRDDAVRQWLWEMQLTGEAEKDQCAVFFSLYQSATRFEKQDQSIRHVMLVHDLIPKLFPEYIRKWTHRFFYHQVLKAIQQADRVLVPSPTTKIDIEHALSVPTDRIQVLPLGVDPVFGQAIDTEILARALSEYGIAPGYLYHGGGLEVRKNTHIVLEAYAQLFHENYPNLPPLVISGRIHAESNPLATPVHSLIESLGIRDQVRLLGVVPSAVLPTLYQGATLFLFPSLYEGFGLPVLEAFTAGTPVITTDGGSLKDLVTPASAVVVPIQELSAERLAAALRDLLDHPEKRDALAMGGRLVAKPYRWQTFSQEALRSLLQ